MPFRRGPDVNPFAGAAHDPLKLLESVTPLELASAVPYVRITKIDFRTGAPALDVRPMMYDLVQGVVLSERFGETGDQFLERSLVSLNSLTVKSQMPNGDIMYREATFRFTVHKPAVMFDRDSRIAWREILEEGNSFQLEYGWRADPTVCGNPLFNGHGHVTESGAVVNSRRATLMYVYRWQVSTRANGEIEVTVDAIENGDLALRDVRFSDAAESTFGLSATRFGLVPRGNDVTNARALKTLLDGVPQATHRGRGKTLTLGDILDNVVAPMVERVTRDAGYSTSSPVQLLLGNFNRRTGAQSVQYGAEALSGRSIGDFRVPVTKLHDQLSTHFAEGRAMTLQNFIRILIGVVGSPEAWADGTDTLRPMIALKLSTVETADGFTLAFALYDRRVVADAVNGLSFLRLEEQSQDDVRRALANADVPMIEFGRAGTAIVDSHFEMQPNPLLQSIQVENASAARKDRVQQTQMPDVESRKGQALPRDIVPISILEGDITMLGNFIFEPPARVWIDFFGSRSISGVFNVLEQTDTLDPGRFTTQLRMMSEGIDPLNTRNRFTERELAEAKARAEEIRRKK